MSVDDESGASDGPDPSVRPVGYVEDRPIIRQIGDRELCLGNEVAADPAAHSHSFEYVVSATDERYPLTTHHRPLIDGRGNEWAAFESAVDTARSLYRRDGAVLIHSKAGISRSTTLIATAIAAEEQRNLHEAVALVRDARPVATPHPALHELAVVYLAAKV